MRPSKWTAIFISALVATGLTAGLYAFSLRHQRAAQEEFALRWARQVASQAEGMFLSARQRGEKDALGWAIGFLSQGIEPRIMRISKFKTDSFLLPEEHRIDERNQMIEFGKVIDSQEGSGIRVQLELQSVGFLGFKNRLLGDLSAVGVFLAIFYLVFPVLRAKKADARIEGIGAGAEPRFASTSPEIRSNTRDRLKEMKDALKTLGLSIRDLVREAQNLAVSASKSRKATGALRDRVHQGINGTRDASRSARATALGAIHAEVLTLNIMAELSRSSVDVEKVQELGKQLHQLVKKLTRDNQLSVDALARLERNLEPIATDADLAYHSYSEVFSSTERMDEFIRCCTSGLLSQAKLLQETSAALGETPQAQAALEPLSDRQSA